MNEPVDFREITNKYCDLQSRIQQQFKRSQELQSVINSLSVNGAPSDHLSPNKSISWNPQIAEKQVVPNPFVETMQSSLEGNSKTKRFCDAIFKVDDGMNASEFYGIRAMYAMHSTVLADILEIDSVLSHSQRPMNVRVEDVNISPSTFQIISHILYGLIHPAHTIDEGNVINLLYAANKYQIDSLHPFCIDFIVNAILQNTENIRFLCDSLNGMIDRDLLVDFDEIISKTIVTEDINVDQ